MRERRNIRGGVEAVRKKNKALTSWIAAERQRICPRRPLVLVARRQALPWRRNRCYNSMHQQQTSLLPL